jgi:hypothetical protein
MTIHDLEATCWEINQDAAGSKKSPNRNAGTSAFMVRMVMSDESTCWTVFHRHFVMTDHSGWAASKIIHTHLLIVQSQTAHTMIL